MCETMIINDWHNEFEFDPSAFFSDPLKSHRNFLFAAAGFGIQAAGLAKKGPKAPPQPKLGPMGSWAQNAVYADIERGMGGGGLTPAYIQNKGYRERVSALKQGYQEIQPELRSFVNRMVRPGDAKVRGYMSNVLGRNLQTTLDDMRREHELEPLKEQQQAQGMGLSLLSQEKRTATDITQMWNQNQQQMAGMPTFGTQLASGLGGAGGWMTAAENYGRLQSQKGGGY